MFVQPTTEQPLYHGHGSYRLILQCNLISFSLESVIGPEHVLNLIVILGARVPVRALLSVSLLNRYEMHLRRTIAYSTLLVILPTLLFGMHC